MIDPLIVSQTVPVKVLARRGKSVAQQPIVISISIRKHPARKGEI